MSSDSSMIVNIHRLAAAIFNLVVGFCPTLYPGLFINNPGTGHKELNSDWPIKTHNPRSKIIENRQINTANTKFRAFRQSNRRRIIILQGNCFQRTTDASQEVIKCHTVPHSGSTFAQFRIQHHIQHRIRFHIQCFIL